MDEFQDAVDQILRILKIQKLTVIKAAESFKDPSNEEKLAEFFNVFYVEWKKRGTNFANPALKFLMPDLYKELSVLQELFTEFDEQPGSPLACD